MGFGYNPFTHEYDETGGGAAQTPWTSDIDGGGFNLSDVNNITAGVVQSSGFIFNVNTIVTDSTMNFSGNGILYLNSLTGDAVQVYFANNSTNYWSFGTYYPTNNNFSIYNAQTGYNILEFGSLDNSLFTPHNVLDDGSGNLTANGWMNANGGFAASGNSNGTIAGPALYLGYFAFGGNTYITALDGAGTVPVDLQISALNLTLTTQGGALRSNTNILDDGAGNMTLSNNFTIGDNYSYPTIFLASPSSGNVKMGDPTSFVSGNYFYADPYSMFWWNNAGGHQAFTVSGDAVTTYNNTLDDGSGNAIFGNVTVFGYYNVGGSANANEFKIGGTTVIDASKNATFSTINGTIGDLISTGKQVRATITKTSNYTIAASDDVVICGANGATFTLPVASSNTGRVITVKNATYSGGSNTLASAGGNIDGAATVTLALGKSRTVLSVNSQWQVIGGVF